MDQQYILGITELDSQHEVIENLMLALKKAIEGNEPWVDLHESLCEKLRFHFHAEETIMRVFAYPEFHEHRKSHLEVLKSVECYKGKKPTDADFEKLRDQPMQLFYEQILYQDMRFAAFIKYNKERLGIQ